MVQTLKELFFAIGDFIDTKLQTKTGRMTLLILGGVILGGCVIHTLNINNRYVDTIADLDKTEKKLDSLQNSYNDYIRNIDTYCNDKIKQGAVLQQQLKDIYNNKIEENKEYIQEQKDMVKEKEYILSVQKENIKSLEKL